MICPRCGQDYLKRATIKPLQEHILICPECEAFWKIGAQIEKSTFADYGDYIESRGYKWDWNLLDFEDKSYMEQD